MNQLIKIETTKQGSAVSARELHSFLEIKSRFNDWIVNRIKKYDLVENQDYITLTKNLVSGGIEKEYVLTLDTAKELSMVEGNKKGKQARQYFIECEKAYKESILPKSISTLDFLQATLDQMKAQENRLSSVEEKVNLIEAQTKTRPDYFTIMGFAINKGVKVGLSMAGTLGRKAKDLCTQKGYSIESIPDPRFGRVGCYPSEVLNEVFNSYSF